MPPEDQQPSFTVLQARDLLPEYRNFKPSDLPTIDEILAQGQGDITRARSQSEAIGISDSNINDLVKDCLTEVLTIEQAARNPDRWNISVEDASHTRLIVDFSAPGTYFSGYKDDRYKNYEWSRYMDRKRADSAAILGIYLAGLLTGNDFSKFTNLKILDGIDPKFTSDRELVRESLQQANICYLYVGTPQETEAISKAVNSKSSFIPSNLVYIVDHFNGERIDNTIDQVKALKEFLENNQSLFRSGDKVDFVLGPQAVRVFRMCQRFDAIPDNLEVQLFPEATPESGIREYPTNEIKASIYYAITDKASLLPTPYKVVGDLKK